MTIATQIDQKRMDLHRMIREMRSLSPKTSTYKKIAADVEKLQIELVAMYSKRAQKK
jgi:hypothetical protein